MKRQITAEDLVSSRMRKEDEVKREDDRISNIVSAIKDSIREARGHGGPVSQHELIYVIANWAPQLGQSVAEKCLEQVFLSGTSDLEPKGIL